MDGWMESCLGGWGGSVSAWAGVEMYGRRRVGAWEWTRNTLARRELPPSMGQDSEMCTIASPMRKCLTHKCGIGPLICINFGGQGNTVELIRGKKKSDRQYGREITREILASCTTDGPNPNHPRVPTAWRCMREPIPVHRRLAYKCRSPGLICMTSGCQKILSGLSVPTGSRNDDLHLQSDEKHDSGKKA